MKNVTVILALVLVMCLLVLSCAPTTSAPTQAPVLTNSESDSRVAELEAKIRQLEAENQRLLEENQQLSSDLAEMTSTLESVQSEIPDILIMVTEIQYDTNELAVYLESLPDLPPPPPGLTITQINNAIEKARDLRELLRDLPDLPPSGWPIIIPFPEELLALDEMRQTFIALTEWVDDLEELPEFLNIAGDLDDLRHQEIVHLQNIFAAMDDIKSILEEIRDASWR
ncbi:hypothetical protein ES708_08420 [subsurface metagenome]